MAHLSPSSIFSPSIARQQQAAQKDWNYIDSWLSNKFYGKKPPPFERNADTLKVLLGLASLNETADEERDLLLRAEAKALQQQREEEEADPDPELLIMLERSLTDSGQDNLHILAELSVVLGQATFETEKISRKLIELQATSFDLEQLSGRVAALEKSLKSELERTMKMEVELEGDAYHPGDSVAKETVDFQRKSRLLAAKLPEFGDSLTSLLGSKRASEVKVGDVKGEEDNLKETMDNVKKLEAQVKSYHGLPHDADLARLELEQLRVELRELTQQRDHMFEGLVERESPRRTRQ